MKAQNPNHQKALDAYYKNPTWKAVYDAAPSNAAKERLENAWEYAYWFWHAPEEVRNAPASEFQAISDKFEAPLIAERNEIDKRMTAEDFRFFASIAVHPKQREYFLKKAEEVAA